MCKVTALGVCKVIVATQDAFGLGVFKVTALGVCKVTALGIRCV